MTTSLGVPTHAGLNILPNTPSPEKDPPDGVADRGIGGLLSHAESCREKLKVGMVKELTVIVTVEDVGPQGPDEVTV